jgi:hypothetical protein
MVKLRLNLVVKYSGYNLMPKHSDKLKLNLMVKIWLNFE